MTRAITIFDEGAAVLGRPQARPQATIAAADFDQAYLEGLPPWDIDGPQPCMVRLFERGAIAGRVLDVGCGTGEIALFLAGKGLEVVGVDVSATAIAGARAKAEQRGIRARFAVADALELARLGERFDTVVDSGLLHVFSDADRVRLVAGLGAVLVPGGRYHLLCFSELATIPGPRRLTVGEIAATFPDGWRLESLERCRFEINPDRWVSGEPAAWLASLRRLGGG
jgi:SAM-dependent methyltransferase